MKTALFKNKNISNTRTSIFFNKSGEGRFFSQNKETHTSFFSTSPVQAKLNKRIPQAKYGKLASRISPRLQFKKSPGKKKSPFGSMDYTQRKATSSAILEIFDAYKSLKIKLPGGKEVIRVEPRYWMVPQKKRDGTERSRNSKRLQGPHKKAHTKNIKKRDGKDIYSAMAATRVGKGSPEQMTLFIQAVVNKAYKKYIKKGKVVPKKGHLPHLGMDRTKWKDRIQEWINRNEIGVDCSGFAYHSLLNARIKAYGKGSAEVKKFKDRYLRKKNGRYKKIPWPGAETYGGKKSYSKIIEKANELQPGDFLVKKATVDTKKRTHIIVVQDVQPMIYTSTGNSMIRITTVDSSGKKADFNVKENKQKKRRIGPQINTYDIGYNSKLSSIRELKDFYFLRPKI